MCIRDRSTGIGELEQRKFGPRVGVYRILDLLEQWEMPGSFYVPAYIAETYPELLPNIVANGHEVAMHGYLHERVDRLTFAENHAVMVKSFEIFGQQLAKQTFGYRSPAWEMTPELFDLLKEFNLQYDSSLMGFDHPYEVNGIVELPVQWLLDDAIFSVIRLDHVTKVLPSIQIKFSQTGYRNLTVSVNTADCLC